MNLTIKIIDSFGYVIYAALAILAVWGVYNGILLYRTLSKKTLADPEPLIGQVRELCQVRKYDAAVSVCQSPAYWHKALAQLIAVALQNRDKGLAKIKQLAGHRVPHRGDRGHGESPGHRFPPSSGWGHSWGSWVRWRA